VLDQFIIGKIYLIIEIYYTNFYLIRAGQLVSAKRAPLASFICGWFNFIGNAAGKYKYHFFTKHFF